MYNETYRTPSARKQKRMLIDLDDMPFNERAAYVESVCATLIESRFGPGHSSPFNYRLREQPELEQAVFDDLTFECTAHFRVTTPDRRIVVGNTVDSVGISPQHFAQACISIHFQNIQPSNQGRGSPCVPGTRVASQYHLR